VQLLCDRTDNNGQRQGITASGFMVGKIGQCDVQRHAVDCHIGQNVTLSVTYSNRCAIA